MRFIDEAKIRVAGGHGGPGCVSFRRETFVPRGGPDGGDGGQGGSVIFVASSQLGSLQDFRYKRVYQADAGKHGSGANKAGRDGQDIVLRVPVGTIIKDSGTGETLIDFAVDGERWVACKGGRGGKGNAHFTTSTHQAPKFAQPGEDGVSLEILLELKLLADVGIIGLPNAGKSTLISRISAARPKIADYAFTTLTPNLGVVSMPDLSSFVVADIPGLVEGAHRGLGLGHKFLRHLERTRVFVHLLDMTPELEEPGEAEEHEVEKLVQRYQVIRNELGRFSEKLLHKPEIIALNKADLFQADPEVLERIRTAFRQRIAALRGTPPLAGEPFAVSAVSGVGVPELLFAIQAELLAYQGKLRLGVQTTPLPDDPNCRR